MRLGDLRRLLADGGQEWPVDDPDDATVGGVIAADVPLPRQLRVGCLRDTVVEMVFVTGDGRRIRSGARTVKNVTGYDLHRLLTGSRGTLGVITQVALKVRPLPKMATTLVSREGGIQLAERLLEAVPLPAAVIAEHDRVSVRLEGWPKKFPSRRGPRTRSRCSQTPTRARGSTPRSPTRRSWCRPRSSPRGSPRRSRRAPGTGRSSASATRGWRAMTRQPSRGSGSGRVARGHRTGGPRRRGARRAAEGRVAQLGARLKAAFDPANILVAERFLVAQPRRGGPQARPGLLEGVQLLREREAQQVLAEGRV